MDHRILLEQQGRIARLEESVENHERRLCTLEKKVDKIIWLEWAILVSIIAGWVASRLF